MTTRGSGEGAPADLARAAREAGVADERVLTALAQVRRSEFVPAQARGAAYLDEPLPIPHGQVTTQPSLSAIMIAGLGLTGGEQVLEVGAGYGYQTALLARLAAHVVSLELWPDLAEMARRNLTAHGIRNVEVVTGDGTQGWQPGAPYDAVLVSAAFGVVPPPLAGQLREGGRLVQPVGPGGEESVTLFCRQAGRLRRVRELVTASFVRLYGKHGYPMAEEG